MSNEMPERIWATETIHRTAWSHCETSGTEYVRADLFSALEADALNAIHAYDTYTRMPSQGYNFRKEDAELAWLSALNQLRNRLQ